MHCDVCILAPEGAFSRLLLLECREAGREVLFCRTPDNLPGAELFIIDADAFPCVLPQAGNLLLFGRTLFDSVRTDGGRMITEWRRPFSLASLRALLASGGSLPTGLVLLPDGETVLLNGRHITLSPTEYACLACLSAAGGAPVSRAALSLAVWGEGPCRDALVNLYIHYLRRKLEFDGRRRIFALRGRGYALREEGCV